jgi:hypothetical protein
MTARILNMPTITGAIRNRLFTGLAGPYVKIEGQCLLTAIRRRWPVLKTQ